MLQVVSCRCGSALPCARPAVLLRPLRPRLVLCCRVWRRLRARPGLGLSGGRRVRRRVGWASRRGSCRWGSFRAGVVGVSAGLVAAAARSGCSFTCLRGRGSWV